MKKPTFEIKFDKKSERKQTSPIKTLLKLMLNIKNKKNLKSSFNNNSNSIKINKVISSGNMNPNYSNINTQKNKKIINFKNKENINFNSNLLLKRINNIKYNNQNSKNSIKLHQNSVVNNINSVNYGRRNKIQEKNKLKISKQKKIKINKNKNFGKKEKIFENNMKTTINYYSNNCKPYNGNKNIKTISATKSNYKLKKSIKNNLNSSNDTFYKTRLKISSKKNEKRKAKYNIKNYTNKYKNIQNIQIEDSNTNRNSCCIFFYNKYLKNNYLKKINDKKCININSNVENNIINKNTYNEIIQPYTTINNKKLYGKRHINLINENNISPKNKNTEVYIKNKSINKYNNLSIDSKSNSLIYTPKRGLYRIHSQENIKKNNIEEFNLNPNVIFKTKSVKDFSDYTYNKKNIISNQKLNINIKKKGIYDIYNSKINDNLISDDNIKKKNYNIKNFLNKDYTKYLNKDNYYKEVNEYPKIKINLRKNNKKIRNNSVVIQDNNNLIINNDFGKEKNSMINNNSRITSKISYNSLISNINRSVNKSISNLSNVSLSDSNLYNYLNNIDIMSFKSFNSNNSKNRILSINDLYYILLLEEKLKDIFNSLLLEKNQILFKYCFDYINFFYNYSLDKFIQNILYNKMDLNNINIFNNNTFFAIIIFYDITFSKNIFKNEEKLLKEIIKLIYSNIILVIRYSYNILENLEKNQENNLDVLYAIVNNILNKYIKNKDLFIDENGNTYEEKINYNINFISRNIHTVINNMKYTQNFNHLLNLLDKINTISLEEINSFFRTKILRINILNSSLLSSTVLKNNYPIKKHKIDSPYLTFFNKKIYTLVLSLDETLVYFKSNNIINKKSLIQLRPGLIEFLQNIKPYYEIIIFSSGNRKYSDLIIDLIEEKYKCIDYRLYQEHCVIIDNDFVKDLSKIGRAIDKIIIVDNIPQNYRLQKENGINIKSFFGDNSNDKILYQLSEILISIIHDGGDVRNSIKKYWKEIILKVGSCVYFNSDINNRK